MCLHIMIEVVIERVTVIIPNAFVVLISNIIVKYIYIYIYMYA